MKILCFILSAYVLLLSAKPCCADHDCQMIKLSAEVTHHQNSDKEKDCTGCSPFFSCGSCVGFIIAKPFSVKLPVTAELKVMHSSSYRAPALAQVTLAIWQPPQLG